MIKINYFYDKYKANNGKVYQCKVLFVADKIDYYGTEYFIEANIDNKLTYLAVPEYKLF